MVVWISSCRAFPTNLPLFKALVDGRELGVAEPNAARPMRILALPMLVHIEREATSQRLSHLSQYQSSLPVSAARRRIIEALQ